MMVLNRQQILKSIEEQNLVSGFIDLQTQLTPNGFDVTVKSVQRISGPGRLDFSNKERVIPKSIDIEPKTNAEKHGWWHLERGVYKVKANEVFRMPLDLISIPKPRSSLLRMGATAYNGIIDAGFEGKIEFLLEVLNENGVDIKENARIVQLVFLRMEETDKGYDGIHKHLS